MKRKGRVKFLFYRGIVGKLLRWMEAYKVQDLETLETKERIMSPKK